ncbi:hypothetical protein [Paenisporosarcina sp. TG-14]|uniref:hypothetical protein n=1 Tax=Paenisporosarcina sp. TG-14 TaxID=1231057 RepID=UPI000310EFAF|nr:hypothetical protein [Paenisporosarcina sp. TG-14]
MQHVHGPIGATFALIGATLVLIEVTFALTGATFCRIGATNQLPPNSAALIEDS